MRPDGRGPLKMQGGREVDHQRFLGPGAARLGQRQIAVGRWGEGLDVVQRRTGHLIDDEAVVAVEVCAGIFAGGVQGLAGAFNMGQVELAVQVHADDADLGITVDNAKLCRRFGHDLHAPVHVIGHQFNQAQDALAVIGPFQAEVLDAEDLIDQLVQRVMHRPRPRQAGTGIVVVSGAESVEGRGIASRQQQSLYGVVIRWTLKDVLLEPGRTGHVAVHFVHLARRRPVDRAGAHMAIGVRGQQLAADLDFVEPHVPDRALDDDAGIQFEQARLNLGRGQLVVPDDERHAVRLITGQN